MFQVIKPSPTCLVLLGPTYLRNSPRRPWLGRKKKQHEVLRSAWACWHGASHHFQDFLIKPYENAWTYFSSGPSRSCESSVHRFAPWIFTLASKSLKFVCVNQNIYIYIYMQTYHLFTICTSLILSYLITHNSKCPLTYLPLHLLFQLFTHGLQPTGFPLPNPYQCGNVHHLPSKNIPGTGRDHKVYLSVKGCRLTGEPWKWRYLLLFVFSSVTGKLAVRKWRLKKQRTWRAGGRSRI